MGRGRERGEGEDGKKREGESVRGGGCSLHGRL